MSDVIADWIAVDWGSTHLRAYAMTATPEVNTTSPDQQVLAEAQSANGMAKLTSEEFEPALLALIGDWLPGSSSDPAGHTKIPVIACGMVGAKQGWKEADYQVLPCSPLSSGGFTSVDTHDPRIAVRILPGLCQQNEADVMRGEEVQIAGLLACNADEFSRVCLPGTHSKWAQLAQGQVTAFSTFMTGEMFAVVSQHTLLRHGVDSNEWDDATFLNAIDQAIAAPQQLLSDLFRIRAKGLLEGMPANQARAHLSGLLIGNELAGAKNYWAGHRIALIGEGALVALYVAALKHLGVECEPFSPKTMTLSGLSKAYQSLTN